MISQNKTNVPQTPPRPSRISNLTLLTFWPHFFRPLCPKDIGCLAIFQTFHTAFHLRPRHLWLLLLGTFSLQIAISLPFGPGFIFFTARITMGHSIYLFICVISTSLHKNISSTKAWILSVFLYNILKYFPEIEVLKTESEEGKFSWVSFYDESSILVLEERTSPFWQKETVEWRGIFWKAQVKSLNFLHPQGQPPFFSGEASPQYYSQVHKVWRGS